MSFIIFCYRPAFRQVRTFAEKSMKTLTANGMKVLKIIHLIFAAMWIGGVMALICMELGTKPENDQMVLMSAIDQLIIDELFLIPGGVGILITAIFYGLFTKWGFWKHTWLKVKWILTILLVIIGAGYMGVLIKENVQYVQLMLATGSDPVKYWCNIQGVAIAGIVQLVGFLAIIIISVFKPWKKVPMLTKK